MLNDIFHFSRDSVQQFFIVNIKSENVAQPVETKEVEAVIDELCKFHTEATAGTDEFVKKEVNDDASYWTWKIAMFTADYSVLLYTREDLDHGPQ